MTKLESIKKHGVTAEGRRALMDYLKGKTLTLKEAVLARCYDCMSYFADGIADCKTTDCPLYVYMPYRKVRRKKEKPAARKTAEKKTPAKKKPAEKKPAQKTPKAAKAPEAKASGSRRGIPKPLSLFGA